MPIRQGGSSHRTRFHLAADDHLTSGTHSTGDVGIVVTACRIAPPNGRSLNSVDTHGT